MAPRTLVTLSLALAALALAAATIAASTREATVLQAEAPSYRDLPAGAGGEAPFAIIGDTQESLPFETLLLGRESNAAERRQLFSRLVAERPAFLVVTGDLTAVGSSASRWRYFDSLTVGLRRLGVPILPVLGNHEYWGSNARAHQHLAARFAQLADSSWYARRYGALALVVLDANRPNLAASAWQRQQQWLVRTLSTFDADTTIRGVLVFAHQPPYTNSTVTHDDATVRETFVPTFLRHHKTRALISGHTHAWEHFVEGRKHFLVSGGGGGPRVTLKRGADAPHRDVFTGSAPRPFHFLWVTPGATGLRIVVRGFDRGQADFHDIDTFDIAW